MLLGLKCSITINISSTLETGNVIYGIFRLKAMRILLNSNDLHRDLFVT